MIISNDGDRICNYWFEIVSRYSAFIYNFYTVSIWMFPFIEINYHFVHWVWLFKVNKPKLWCISWIKSLTYNNSFLSSTVYLYSHMLSYITWANWQCKLIKACCLNMLNTAQIYQTHVWRCKLIDFVYHMPHRMHQCIYLYIQWEMIRQIN